ncbi:MAG: isoprenyl transferase [Alphaproteobacteria bacterium]|nr:isoprenyl transferase [Alphaproteobacteria bacterium]
MSTLAPAISEPANVPRHVAIIMDGNGRWAKARGLPRIAGHQRGAEAVREAIKGCIELGIGVLTLFAFSSENWRRPAAEVSHLMTLLQVYVRRELGELAGAGVRVSFIGDRGGLPRETQELLRHAEQETAANRRLLLQVALNYGARRELVEACRKIAIEAVAGRIDPAQIDEASIATRLETAGVPDPDLLIRTSGEKRLSNFLLWQVAYGELLFMDTLWPDFTRQHLRQAVDEFQQRERRYGAVSA